MSPRKRWIGFSAQPRGTLVLDDGAYRAIVRDGRSLLSIGIAAVTGNFKKGDAVRLCDPRGQEVARGLTNYSSDEIGQIRGLKSDQITSVLGHCPYDEVVHRNNMTVTHRDS